MKRKGISAEDTAQRAAVSGICSPFISSRKRQRTRRPPPQSTATTRSPQLRPCWRPGGSTQDTSSNGGRAPAQMRGPSSVGRRGPPHTQQRMTSPRIVPGPPHTQQQPRYTHILSGFPHPPKRLSPQQIVGTTSSTSSDTIIERPHRSPTTGDCCAPVKFCMGGPIPIAHRWEEKKIWWASWDTWGQSMGKSNWRSTRSWASSQVSTPVVEFCAIRELAHHGQNVSRGAAEKADEGAPVRLEDGVLGCLGGRRAVWGE